MIFQIKVVITVDLLEYLVFANVILNILCTPLLLNFHAVNILSRAENSMDPAKMASSIATLSGSAVFSKKDNSGFGRTRVNNHTVALLGDFSDITI